ncbi:M23 family metallopeptidase [Ralstonia wenshanensis]|uniref:M23 family metallopeptidase n=1 Tax=Ralstonia wenshanensis TaxID=2842456 RepID=UPI0039C5E9B8
MLISYPILETPQANDTEETVLARMLARATSPAGQYPANTIGQYKVWHGGLHLEATNATPIRAIADGMIVAYRQAQASEQYQNQPYDTSFVLIKHETETGENTPVVFYSLYMHLASRDALTADQISSLPQLFQQAAAIGPDAKSPPVSNATQRKQARVYRKDILGYPGLQYGQTDRRVHFEMFTTEEHLRRFWKDSTTVTNQTASADFYGDAHFIIPAGKSFTDRHPRASQPHRIVFDPHHDFPLDLGQAGTVLDQLFVTVRLDKGRRIATTYAMKNGVCEQVGSPIEQANYEYELFRLASALYQDCPSAGFEWLRFGRILSGETTTTNENWQLVRYTDTDAGYIDLAEPDIVKLSDADFPYWKGWEKFQEGQLASPTDAFVDDPHALAMINDTIGAGQQKLRHLIVKHPSEWDATDLGARYSKLRQQGEALESDDSWQSFETHVQKLAFWGQTGGLDRSVWHFHPLEIIYHFRKCGWLHKSELTQLLPVNSLRKDGSVWRWEPVHMSGATLLLGNTSDAANRRLALNKALNKYCIGTPIRKACFFGNATQETQWYQKFHEGSPYWYKPWDGRGFLQLTHAANYCKYWKFKGEPVTAQVESTLAAATQTANNNRPVVNNKKQMTDPTNSLSDANTHIPQNVINKRNSVAEAFDAANSAGAYWMWSSASKSADDFLLNPQNTRRQVNTDHGARYYYENQAFGSVAGTVNTGSPSSSYSAIWGVQARFQAFSNAQVVLLDTPVFEHTDGVVRDIPQGFERREVE